jgi:methylaspartate ammonia-lyase
MSGKDIKFGIEGRAAMLKGVDLLADAVQVSRKEKGKDTQRYRERFLWGIPSQHGPNYAAKGTQSLEK